MTAPSGEPGLDPTPSAPTAPAPGAPATAPQPTTPQGLDPNAPIDFSNLPANVSAYIANLRHENGGHRQGRTAAEQEATSLREQLDKQTNEANERATAQAEAAWGNSVKLQIYQRAAELGADAAKLIEDDDFVDSLDDLADDDPDTAKFSDALQARITKAVKANPQLAAQQQRSGPMRQGADITGSGGGQRSRSHSLEDAVRRRLGG